MTLQNYAGNLFRFQILPPRRWTCPWPSLGTRRHAGRTPSTSQHHQNSRNSTQEFCCPKIIMMIFRSSTYFEYNFYRLCWNKDSKYSWKVLIVIMGKFCIFHYIKKICVKFKHSPYTRKAHIAISIKSKINSHLAKNLKINALLSHLPCTHSCHQAGKEQMSGVWTWSPVQCPSASIRPGAACIFCRAPPRLCTSWDSRRWAQTSSRGSHLSWCPGCGCSSIPSGCPGWPPYDQLWLCSLCWLGR